MPLAQYAVKPRDRTLAELYPELRAVHLDHGNLSAAAGWCGATVETESTRPGRWTTKLILNSDVTAEPGDWVVRAELPTGLQVFAAYEDAEFMRRYEPA